MNSKIDLCPRRGDLGGRINDNLSGSINTSSVNSFENIGGDVSFAAGPANVNFGVALQDKGDAAYRGSARGGYIASSNGIFASNNRSGDGGFAIVDLGVPDVDVLNGFGARVTTNSGGIAVVRLPTLQAAQISIDPNSAPDDLDTQSVTTTVHRRGG